MNKKKIILRFIMTYVLILVPLLGTSLLMSKEILRREKKSQYNKLYNQLEEVETAIVRDFLNYQAKSILLFENDEFSSDLVFKNPLATEEAIRLLHSMMTFDINENNLLLYYGTGNFLSSAGIVSPRTFFSKTMTCTPSSVNKVMEIITKNQEGIHALERNNDSVLLYYIPIGKDINGYIRSVAIVVSSSRVASILDNYIKSENILVSLSFGTEGVLYYYCTDEGVEYVSQNKLEAIRNNMDDSFLEINNSKNDIKVCAWYNSKEQLFEYNRLVKNNNILLLIGVGISVFFSVGLSTMRLSDLNKFVNSLVNKKIEPESKWYLGGNEYGYMQTILHEAFEESIRIRDNVNIYRKLLINQVSEQIFHGLLRDKDKIRDLLSVCEKQLREEYFFVYGLRMNDEEQIERIQELFCGDIHYILKERNNIFVFLLGEINSYDYDMKMRNGLAAELRQLLKEEFIICSQIVMSQVYHHISMVKYAYLEATNILKSSLKEKRETFCWEEWILVSKKINVVIGEENVNFFRNAIAENDLNSALQALSDIMARREHDYEDSIYLRYIIMQSLILELDNDTEKQNIEIELREINVENEHEFEQNVKEILRKYLKKEIVTEKKDFSMVLQFINENYNSYNMSLELVAEYLGISKVQMSRLFKKKMGIGYIDYVNQLKMEKTKELLENSDLSVKEIFFKVGYSDLVSARKKFKEYYNINPMEYRKMKKGEDDSNAEDL